MFPASLFLFECKDIVFKRIHKMFTPFFTSVHPMRNNIGHLSALSLPPVTDVISVRMCHSSGKECVSDGGGVMKTSFSSNREMISL